jgi:tetratricopeptide (TPR) repeat protein
MRFGFSSQAEAVLADLEKAMRNSENEFSDNDLAQGIRLRLKQDHADEAKQWLDVLKRRDADSTSTLLLQARWLEAVGRDDEIGPMLEEFGASSLAEAKNSTRKAAIYFAVGQIYSSIGFHEQATKWYELLSGCIPDGFVPLATCLTRQGKFSEALRLCERAVASRGKTRVANVVAQLATISETLTEPDFQSALRLVSEALEENPEDIGLTLSLGTLYAKQHRVAEARKMYQRVLRSNPRHVVALNNLATLLSEEPDSTLQALSFIDRALTYAGVMPGLLDTKGTVLMNAGRTREAMTALKMACWSDETDPRYWFHLAVAADALGDTTQSAVALQRAMEDGLEDRLLTPGDLNHLARLRDQLTSTNPPSGP